MTKEEAKLVKVGEYVAFKCDVEQTGKVLAIRTDRYRGIEYQIDVKRGEYRGIQWIQANDCW